MQPIEKLVATARIVGGDWTEGPYYDEAEPEIERQWIEIVWPIIKDCDFSCVVEIGAGHGRNSEKLRHLSQRLVVTDINIQNIVFLRQRFKDLPNVEYVQNDGVTLKEIPDGEATFIYSFDAMVHFDSDIIRSYLREFYRVLQPGGFGFCHYSNYSQNPTGSYRMNPAWRNFMSRELFEHYATKEGLQIASSELRDWLGDGSHLDCLTLFQRPAVTSPASGLDNGMLEVSDAWVEDQRSNWKATAADQTAQLEQLRQYLAELETAKAWLAEQRTNWERLATERGVALQREQAWRRALMSRFGWARPVVRLGRRLMR